MLKPKSKIDLAESCKVVYEKAGSHLSDYFLFYILSSIGLVLGVFYFIYQYTHHQFAFWDEIMPFNLGISLFQIVNYFWVALVVLALMVSSFLYSSGRVALRKKNSLENELKRKTEEYGKIVENVPVSILTLDKSGAVVSGNPYFTELSGKLVSEKIGKSIFDFGFVRESEELSMRYRNLLEKGEPFQYINYTRGAWSPKKFLNFYAVPLRNKKGEVDGAISVAQDNTETFLALEEVRARVKQIHLINQITRAINSVLNLREVLWLILRNAVKITNAVSGAILLLENENELVIKEAYNMPPGWQTVRVKIGQGLCGHAAFIKQPYFSNDVRNDPYFIGQPEIENIKSELAVPILLEKDVIGVIKIDSDELDRFKEEDAELMTTLANSAAVAIANSQLYEKVKDLNKNLEEKVQQRTEELKVANQKLEKSIELKSQFIADASHELRTPLTIMKGNLDIALWDEKANAKELRETLKSIDEEISHMSGILADLMVLTHAGSGKLNLKKTKSNLGNLLKTAAQSMDILAKEKNIKVEILGEEKIEALIDENKFLKLLLNLISNAIKYGKKNGWVRLSSESNNQEIRIAVADNGMGIPEDEAQFIFERFYRVNKVRTRERVGGSGLGLAICKSIAEAHGGYIDVQSKLGEGSQFIVHLPNNKIDFIEG
ncbi:GAF domain-containing protein [Candidatus Falkowbacteria bacterium]|nr:GAF domain-containing protein [Candidatus Falkowbacteria bacterium]